MSTRLVDLVRVELDRFLSERQSQLAEIAPELAPFSDFATELLSGGKRFRALFCYWGWQAVIGSETSFDPLEDAAAHRDRDSVVLAASALEIFHAAALVHDDIMDRSDTRRGMPAAHRRFESMHRDGGWLGTPEHFGTSSALLLGDLLLGWSDELFDIGLTTLSSTDASRAARSEFHRMRTEVTMGQYLDVLEESTWPLRDPGELMERAHRVIVYKSAKYSVEAPLAIGGSLGGASIAQLAALREFGLPLGIAYQLRDDVLGVFGDSALTGKPSGDDLREGKSTVLVATARTRLPEPVRRTLDELLGDPELDDAQIAMLQSAIRDCGALDAVEELIERAVHEAIATLESTPLSRQAKSQLSRLAESVVTRTA